MSERERVIATIEGASDELLVLEGTIRFDDHATPIKAPPKPVLVRTRDGRALRLSGFEHAKKIGRFTAEGKWGELIEQHPFLQALAAERPRAKHTRAHVRLFVLRGGDAVELEISHVQRDGGALRARVRRAAMPGLSLDDESEAKPAPRDAPATPAIPARPERRHRVVGALEGPPNTLLFARLRMTAGDATETRAIGDDAVSVRCDDGSIVRVRSLSSAAHLGAVSLSDTYGAVRDEALVRPFANSAPGDHVRVRVEGFALLAGDRVAVDGVVEDESFAEAAPGFRSAASATISAVRAERIAAGASPEALLDAQTAPEPTAAARPRETQSHLGPSASYPLQGSMIAYGVVGSTLLFPALLAGWFGPMISARSWFTAAACVGWALCAIAINRALRGPLHSSYVTRAGGKRITDKGALWGYRADLALAIALVMCAPFSALAKTPHVHTVVLGAAAIVSALHALLLLVQERPFRAFASRVLSAKAGDPASGDTVALEAIVRTPGLALKRSVEFVWHTTTSYSTGSDGQPYERQSSVLEDHESTAVVSSAIELEGPSQRVQVEPAKARCAFAARRWTRGAQEASYTEELVEGDPVLVVGRFEADERGARVARSTGEESLFLWGGTRSQLRATLWRARGKVALLALCAAVPIALGAYVHPYGARFRASAVVTESTMPGVTVATRCTLSVLAYDGSMHPRCKASLVCGERRLFGGWAMGQTDCTFARDAANPTVSGADESRFDGDPALSFDLQQQRAQWSDDKSTATITFALDHPEAALTFP